MVDDDKDFVIDAEVRVRQSEACRSVLMKKMNASKYNMMSMMMAMRGGGVIMMMMIPWR